MRRIDRNTVQLTDAEMVVTAWHASLLDKGMGVPEAVQEILGAVPDDGTDNAFVEAMADEKFVAFLGE